MTITDTCQLDFAVRMFKAYLFEHKLAQIYDRRVHYWITKQPHDSRLIPGPRGVPRLYENTAYEYNRFVELIGRARMKGLIKWDQVYDNKNDPILLNNARTDGKGQIILSGLNPFSIDEISPFLQQSWESLLKEVEGKKLVTEPKFANQTHYLLIVIEKSTADTQIKQIADRYGADFQIFKGQPSFTREYDAVLRAKRISKPMAIFYISDLDPAGYDMPTAYFRQINEMYPNPEHKLIRVALSREQAVKHNIPEDPAKKGIVKARMDRFEKETGGRTCVELDAMEIDDLIFYLEEAIKPFAHLEDDKKQNDDLNKKWDDLNADANLQISEFLKEHDFRHLKPWFDESEREIEAINEEIEKLNERISRVQSVREAVKLVFNERLEGSIEIPSDEEEIESSIPDSPTKIDSSIQDNPTIIKDRVLQDSDPDIDSTQEDEEMLNTRNILNLRYKCSKCGKLYRKTESALGLILPDAPDNAEFDDKTWEYIFSDGRRTPGYLEGICDSCKGKPSGLDGTGFDFSSDDANDFGDGSDDDSE